MIPFQKFSRNMYIINKKIPLYESAVIGLKYGGALSPLRGALPEGEPICASHSGRGGSAADGEGYSFSL